MLSGWPEGRFDTHLFEQVVVEESALGVATWWGHDLVLAVSVAHSFAGMSNDVMDMPRFWRRSVCCGIAAKELAALCNVLDSDRLFVGGLLRDIGHLLMYQYAAAKAVQAMELAAAQQAPLYKAERAVLGVDFARIGADLMRQWQLPQTLWEVTEYHIEPVKSEAFALSTCIVHIAAIIADVRARGDAALIELTERFDRLTLTPGTLAFSEAEIDAGAVDVRVAEAVVADALAELEAMGITDVIVDPGISINYRGDYLAYTRMQLDVIRGLDALRGLGRPILVPIPRKQEDHRVAAYIAMALEYRADMIRVHDVEMACDLARLYDRLPGQR